MLPAGSRTWLKGEKGRLRPYPSLITYSRPPLLFSPHFLIVFLMTTSPEFYAATRNAVVNYARWEALLPRFESRDYWPHDATLLRVLPCGEVRGDVLRRDMWLTLLPFEDIAGQRHCTRYGSGLRNESILSAFSGDWPSLRISSFITGSIAAKQTGKSHMTVFGWSFCKLWHQILAETIQRSWSATSRRCVKAAKFESFPVSRSISVDRAWSSEWDNSFRHCVPEMPPTMMNTTELKPYVDFRRAAPRNKWKSRWNFCPER